MSYKDTDTKCIQLEAFWRHTPPRETRYDILWYTCYVLLEFRSSSAAERKKEVAGSAILVGLVTPRGLFLLSARLMVTHRPEEAEVDAQGPGGLDEPLPSVGLLVGLPERLGLQEVLVSPHGRRLSRGHRQVCRRLSRQRGHDRRRVWRERQG